MTRSEASTQPSILTYAQPVNPRVVAATASIAVSAALTSVAPAEADTIVTATVVSWSDGDTVVTDLGKVRLIGINAPDKKECGYKAAGKSAKTLAPVGSTVT